MSELKPCPFCGSPAERKGNRRYRKGYAATVGCTSQRCPAKIEQATLHGTVEDAYIHAENVWNRRAKPANEPLTLEDGFDITNADGTPVDYDVLGMKYKDQLCYCDIDGFYVGEDGGLVLMDDCGKAVSVDRSDYHIEVHKPGGEQDA